MRVGLVGAGKLGMPMALALDHIGHEVFITDISEDVYRHFENRTWPHIETHVQDLLPNHRMEWVNKPELLDVDIAFVAVQTPHKPQFDGTKPVTEPPEDFDYSYLADALVRTDAPIVAVVSTVLPGTWRDHFQEKQNYVYNPSFIAMGTVIDDLRNAEFNLIGAEQTNHMPLLELWRTVNDAITGTVDITTAEAIKVAYNSFISMKIALANTWGWLGEEIGFDSETVMRILSLADRRLISSAYLMPGMGDGGACHPRDLIALSWLADKYGVYNLFAKLTEQREKHTAWLSTFAPIDVVVFGKAFKPDSEIDDGSPVYLLNLYLNALGKGAYASDDPKPGPFNFIATAHSRYRDIEWPKGSTVIDPHGIIQDQEGVTVRRIGRP